MTDPVSIIGPVVLTKNARGKESRRPLGSWGNDLAETPDFVNRLQQEAQV